MTCAEINGWGSSSARRPIKVQQPRPANFSKHEYATARHAPASDTGPTSMSSIDAMSLLRQLPQVRPYICRRCVRNGCSAPGTRRQTSAWAKKTMNSKREASQWQERAHRIRNGLDKGMLQILEERGFVKDVAGCVLSSPPRGTF